MVEKVKHNANSVFKKLARLGQIAPEDLQTDQMVRSCPSCRTKMLLFVPFPFVRFSLKPQFPALPETNLLRLFHLDSPELARTHMQGRRLRVGFPARRFS